MTKSIKKSFIFGLVFAICSIFACLGGVSFRSQEKAEAADVYVEKINDADKLKDIMRSYGSSGAVTKYVLTADIDMNGIVLNSTIGTAENPYKGIFDGQGHTISNLTIDLSKTLQGSEVVSDNKYAGLFGVTDGATIMNVQLSGEFNYTIGQCTTAYVGALVGSSTNSTIKYIQNVSTIKLGAQKFNHGLVYGGLVGRAVSTKMSYIINRQTGLVSFSFEDNNNRINSLGGVVGSLSESCLVFGVSKTNLSFDIGKNYSGTVNAGGVFGTVNGSNVIDGVRVSVVNMLVENNLTLRNNLTTDLYGKIYVGQIGGAISSPYPEALAISSIYYKKNINDIARFGQLNNYVFQNQATYDNILETNIQFVNEAMVNATNMKWHTKLGYWDFETKWYFNTSTIYLQSFMGGFKVDLAQNLANSGIFKVEKEMNSSYLFEETAEIVFSFKEIEDGANMARFYTITGLKQGNTDNKVTIDYTNGSYKVSSDPDNYSISENNGIFTIIIRNVNKSTAGTYDINYKANEFTITATTRLYDADGSVQDVSDPPGNIYYAGGSTPVKLPVNITMTYNTTRTIEARLRNSSLPYALDGWYLENEEGSDILLGSTNAYEIKFGSGYFTGDEKIYAKYRNDACRISFDIKGDGISEIHVREELVQGNVATVSKTLSSLKLEIYVKEGYEFDVKRFLDMISTYRGEDTTTPFCTWSNQDAKDENYYVFTLDMTTLKGEFAEEFSVIIDTEKVGAGSNNMIWYIVGGAGGAVVLGVAIFLIVFFVKRKSGGGKLGGGYGGKKSFKGGYY